MASLLNLDGALTDFLKFSSKPTSHTRSKGAFYSVKSRTSRFLPYNDLEYRVNFKAKHAHRLQASEPTISLELLEGGDDLGHRCQL